jgi:hypothetical protein
MCNNCKKGFFYNISNNKCLKCSIKCSSCEFYFDNCIECNEILILQTPPLCGCKKYYYENFSILLQENPMVGTCQRCENYCYSC